MNENYTIGGASGTFLSWCQKHGRSPLRVRAFMSNGMGFAAALETEPRAAVFVTLHGRTRLFEQWCWILHRDIDETLMKVDFGYTLEEALGLNHEEKRNQVLALTKTFLDWCADYGADPLEVRARLSFGYSLTYALYGFDHGDVRSHGICIRHRGIADTLVHHCERENEAMNTIIRRIRQGIPIGTVFDMKGLSRKEYNRLCKGITTKEKYTIRKPLSVWCEDYKKDEAGVRALLENGTPLRDALVMSAPLLSTTQDIPEFLNTLPQICEGLGVAENIVSRYLTAGDDLDTALEKALQNRLRNRKHINGEKLRELRTAKGMSLRRLAKLVKQLQGGVTSHYSIHMLESGGRMATAEELLAFCAIFGVEESELVHGHAAVRNIPSRPFETTRRDLLTRLLSEQMRLPPSSEQENAISHLEQMLGECEGSENRKYAGTIFSLTANANQVEYLELKTAAGRILFRASPDACLQNFILQEYDTLVMERLETGLSTDLTATVRGTTIYELGFLIPAESPEPWEYDDERKLYYRILHKGEKVYEFYRVDHDEAHTRFLEIRGVIPGKRLLQSDEETPLLLKALGYENLRELHSRYRDEKFWFGFASSAFLTKRYDVVRGINGSYLHANEEIREWIATAEKEGSFFR